MTRRAHACLTCPAMTRHRGPCAACRRRGITLVGDELILPLEISPPHSLLRLVRCGSSGVRVTPADPAAPTVAELEAGIDLTCFIQPEEPR